RSEREVDERARMTQRLWRVPVLVRVAHGGVQPVPRRSERDRARVVGRLRVHVQVEVRGLVDELARLQRRGAALLEVAAELAVHRAEDTVVLCPELRPPRLV